MNQADVLRHNRQAWDKLVERGDRWTKPVDRATIQRARAGEFAIVLTPTHFPGFSIRSLRPARSSRDAHKAMASIAAERWQKNRAQINRWDGWENGRQENWGQENVASV
ncbi:hypothetical protein Enr13x_26590 [Stieleria neptunia]|uniref:Uncharacterized protein n=1 Tax=Stieleria neptunia TaxID=2527979 RepID=A0A518HPP0_9BACT|nr:hypothetical protein [Stieleria neptunia]QDV42809.1 hypothetical protein Enr13x_26590 [Stieleria neptunia]